MPNEPFYDIIKFYKDIDQLLPFPDLENPCGECKECCRYFFYCSQYEYEYLKHYVEDKRINIPLIFKPASTPDGDRRSVNSGWCCPLYRENAGCLAYAARPYACRIMGHYVPRTTNIPGQCIFRSPVNYSTHDEMPLWKEYVKLLLAHPPSKEFQKGGYIFPFV
ncbi:MAG: YkgJ family cysteine cluster protein [Firmicutes bacterium]|nr:YkgJ family cysteine cluster protein [Bacillota bacterium]